MSVRQSAAVCGVGEGRTVRLRFLDFGVGVGGQRPFEGGDFPGGLAGCLLMVGSPKAVGDDGVDYTTFGPLESGAKRG